VIGDAGAVAKPTLTKLKSLAKLGTSKEVRDAAEAAIERIEEALKK